MKTVFIIEESGEIVVLEDEVYDKIIEHINRYFRGWITPKHHGKTINAIMYDKLMNLKTVIERKWSEEYVRSIYLSLQEVPIPSEYPLNRQYLELFSLFQRASGRNSCLIIKRG